MTCLPLTMYPRSKLLVGYFYNFLYKTDYIHTIIDIQYLGGKKHWWSATFSVDRGHTAIQQCTSLHELNPEMVG